MLKPISRKFRGLITISGPIKSGKSQLAEYLIKDQESITYIATAKRRNNDIEWQKKIDEHRLRRPNTWSLVESPHDICRSIDSMDENESILIDSLGGIVEQHIDMEEDQWELFQSKFANCLIQNNLRIFLVSEEIGWGMVPATPIGHKFRERLSKLSLLLSRHSTQKWLAINGIAIELDKIGYLIP